MKKYVYFICRMGMWCLALLVASVPTIKHALHHDDFNEGEILRDLLFVMVPVSALALASAFDFLITAFPNLKTRNFFYSCLSSLLHLVDLVAGVSGFASIEPGHIGHWMVFGTYILVAATVTTGFVNEWMVTINHHSFTVVLPRWCPTNHSKTGLVITKDRCIASASQ